MALVACGGASRNIEGADAQSNGAPDATADLDALGAGDDGPGVDGAGRPDGAMYGHLDGGRDAVAPADSGGDAGPILPGACDLAPSVAMCGGSLCSSPGFWYDPQTGQCEGECTCASDAGVFGTAAACRAACVDAVPHATCASAGGQCTTDSICPMGTEPVYPDPHRDCGPEAGAGGYCCVTAPSSPCSSAANDTCALGTVCSGIWSLPVNLACEAGRVCCRIDTRGASH